MNSIEGLKSLVFLDPEAMRPQSLAHKESFRRGRLTNALPVEVITEVFRFLFPRDVVQVSYVCRGFYVAASDETSASVWKTYDVKKLFPKLSIIDRGVWERHVDLSRWGLSFEAAAPCPNRKLILNLPRLFASLNVEGGAGITLLVMPQGLTFNKLVEINPAAFEYIWDRIPEVLGEIFVERTYQVVITNSVLEESRNKSVSQQQALVEKLDCKMPRVLEVSALVILTFISSSALSPTRLYNDSPWTYTRCIEKLDGYSIVVGSFTSEGFDVHDNNFDNVDYGVGAVQKF
jgi:hypothetical protein